MASQTDELIKRREYQAGRRASVQSPVRIPEPTNAPEPEDSEDEAGGEAVGPDTEGGAEEDGVDQRSPEGAQQDQGAEAGSGAPASEAERARALQQERRSEAKSSENNFESDAAPESAAGGDQADQSKFKAALSKFRQGRGTKPAEAQTAEAAKIAGDLAETAYRSVWKALHEAAEDSAFALWMIPFYSLIPVWLAVFRVFIGNFVGRFWTIHFAGAEVPLVPSIMAEEAPRRAGVNAILMVLALAWYVVIAVVVALIQSNWLEQILGTIL